MQSIVEFYEKKPERKKQEVLGFLIQRWNLSHPLWSRLANKIGEYSIKPDLAPITLRQTLSLVIISLSSHLSICSLAFCCPFSIFKAFALTWNQKTVHMIKWLRFCRKAQFEYDYEFFQGTNSTPEWSIVILAGKRHFTMRFCEKFQFQLMP